jgi:hypothetical protein
MTLERDGEEQSVRRIFVVALLLALLAGAAALAVELASVPSGAPSLPTLLPATFRQSGFTEDVAHARQRETVRASERRNALRTHQPARTVVYVVARCDTGRVTAKLGGLTSATACTGRPVGVVRLTLTKPGVTLTVTVDRAQRSPWAVGIYR